MNPIEQIKNRLSILDVVSTYVRLEKSGNQFKGRCPFHNEKTPSFYVSPDRNSYHCFGCNKGGDIFSFIQDIEHLPFRESLEMLASRAGVELRDFKKSDEANSLLAVLEEATTFFQENLFKTPSVRMYAEGRGMSQDTLSNFRVGYAKNEWQHLFNHLRGKGYSEKEIADAGLAIQSEQGRFYDRFRGRLMFPITNASGKVVGFTGRVLPETQQESPKELAKYVNTPETELYHKSKILFGYDKARQDIVKNNLCIVVEGQMDTIMTHQAGTENVVGVSGTAFTDDQLSMILRMTQNIALSFDSDKAGQNAMLRSAELALLAGANVDVIDLGNQKDPADIVVENPQIWFDAIQKREHIVSYLLRKIRNEIEDDRHYALEVRRVVIPIISFIKSHIDREVLLNKIATSLAIHIDAVREDLRNYVANHSIANKVERKTDEKTQKKLALSYTEKLIVTYEEVIGMIELHTELSDENTHRILSRAYGLNIPELVRYEDFPDQEKQKLHIKAEILNSDEHTRLRNFKLSLLELEERIVDIEVQKISEMLKTHTDQDTVLLYQKLLKERNTIRTHKISHKSL